MAEPKTDILQFQTQLGHNLARWGGFSIASGLIFTILSSPTWRGVGSQFVGWGIIDLAIAWFGLRSARKKAGDPTLHEPEPQAKERTNLKKVLWINTGLDVVYVAGGVVLAKTKGRTNRFWRGAGWGIIIQGGFLFLFDLINALLVERQSRTTLAG